MNNSDHYLTTCVERLRCLKVILNLDKVFGVHTHNKLLCLPRVYILTGGK